MIKVRLEKIICDILVKGPFKKNLNERFPYVFIHLNF